MNLTQKARLQEPGSFIPVKNTSPNSLAMASLLKIIRAGYPSFIESMRTAHKKTP